MVLIEESGNLGVLLGDLGRGGGLVLVFVKTLHPKKDPRGPIREGHGIVLPVAASGRFAIQ